MLPYVVYKGLATENIKSIIYSFEEMKILENAIRSNITNKGYLDISSINYELDEAISQIANTFITPNISKRNKIESPSQFTLGIKVVVDNEIIVNDGYSLNLSVYNKLPCVSLLQLVNFNEENALCKQDFPYCALDQIYNDKFFIIKQKNFSTIKNSILSIEELELFFTDTFTMLRGDISPLYESTHQTEKTSLDNVFMNYEKNALLFTFNERTVVINYANIILAAFSSIGGFDTDSIIEYIFLDYNSYPEIYNCFFEEEEIEYAELYDFIIKKIREYLISKVVADNVLKEFDTYLFIVKQQFERIENSMNAITASIGALFSRQDFIIHLKGFSSPPTGQIMTTGQTIKPNGTIVEKITVKANATDANGLKKVSVAFVPDENQDPLVLCEDGTSNPCYDTSDSWEIQEVNPADYGASEGEIELGLHVVDDDGDYQIVSTHIFTWERDTTPPELNLKPKGQIISPTGHVEGNITVKVNAADANGLHKVSLAFVPDKNQVPLVLCEDYTSNPCYGTSDSWDIPDINPADYGASEGQVTLELRVQDKFYLDYKIADKKIFTWKNEPINTPSTGQIISPTGTVEGNITVRVNVTDWDGLNKVSLAFVAITSIDPLILCEDDTLNPCNNTKMNWNICKVDPTKYGAKEGEVVIELKVKDDFGNIEIIDIHSFHWRKKETDGVCTIETIGEINGSIYPHGTIDIEYGSDQSFKIVPDPGYKIKDVIVDCVSLGEIQSYNFINVIEDHLIETIFEYAPQ